MTTLKAIDHLTVPTADLDIAEHFYVEVLGATLVQRFDRATFLRFRPDLAHVADGEHTPLRLELRFGTSGPALEVFLERRHARRVPLPHPHIAIAIDPDELDDAHDRLREAGVITDGPRQMGPPGQASLYFTDPDGNLLELVTRGYRGAVEQGPPDLNRFAV